ncbi:hypothetical protein D3C72_2277140 [compost metagenome]
MAGNRFIQRFATQQQQNAVDICLDLHIVAIRPEQGPLPVADDTAAQAHQASQHDNGSTPAVVQRQVGLPVLVQAHIPYIHRAESACRPNMASEPTGDQSHATSLLR